MLWFLALLACGPSQAQYDRVQALENGERTAVAELEALTERIEHLERRQRTRDRIRGRSGDTPSITVVELPGVERLGDDRYRVPRPGLRGLLADDAPVGDRAIPAYRDGQQDGIKLYGVRRGSAAASLGFRNGDTVHKVGSVTIDADTTREALRALLTEDELAVALSRRGTPTTLTWTLVDSDVLSDPTEESR